jgi:hypothetical protein
VEGGLRPCAPLGRACRRAVPGGAGGFLVAIGGVGKLARAFEDHRYASHASLAAGALNELKTGGLPVLSS